MYRPTINNVCGGINTNVDRRKPNWSDAENSFLVEQLLPYKEVIASKQIDGNTNRLKQKAWSKVTESLNARNTNGMVERTVEEVKRKWKNLCYLARREVLETKMKESSGSEFSDTSVNDIPASVSPFSKMVLSICGMPSQNQNGAETIMTLDTCNFQQWHLRPTDDFIELDDSQIMEVQHDVKQDPILLDKDEMSEQSGYLHDVRVEIVNPTVQTTLPSTEVPSLSLSDKNTCQSTISIDSSVGAVSMNRKLNKTLSPVLNGTSSLSPTSSAAIDCQVFHKTHKSNLLMGNTPYMYPMISKLIGRNNQNGIPDSDQAFPIAPKMKRLQARKYRREEFNPYQTATSPAENPNDYYSEKEILELDILRLNKRKLELEIILLEHKVKLRGEHVEETI